MFQTIPHYSECRKDNYLLGHIQDFNSALCNRSVLVHGVNGWVQQNILSTMLPLTRHLRMRSIHQESRTK